MGQTGAKVVALSGGIGGAKLAQGLAGIMDPKRLVIVANTGDDFEHLGLTVCPDIDTLIYTLAGVSNPETGWGRADETWMFMRELRETQPQEAWFALGDKDLEVHRFRTRELQNGATLAEVTAALARDFGVRPTILPMSNDAVRTHLLAETDGQARWLGFQEYFVREQCAPRVQRMDYRGAAHSAPTPELRELLEEGDVEAVVICPSNPYLSIDPILSVPGMADLLRRCGAPVVAVSPIVGGKALKGPTAKIMGEFGLACDIMTIATHYGGLLDGLVIDEQDSDFTPKLGASGLPFAVTNTVMKSLEDRRRLAREVLEFAGRITRREGDVGRRTG